MNLNTEQVSRKSSRTRIKSDAQKLIPPKKKRGRRTAAEEKSVAWIVATVESLPVRLPMGLPVIPSVVCLPCLDIKVEVKAEKVVSSPARELRRPPTPAPRIKNLMGVPVAPMKPTSSTPTKENTLAMTPPLQERAVNGTETKIVQKPEVAPLAQGGSGLDRDLAVWMKAAFNQYITLAGKKPNSGRAWGFRLAQIACGFEVMVTGIPQVKEIFPSFVTALFNLLDASRSTRDLDLLESIVKNTVYLDVLAETAEFQAKNGAVSVNFERRYKDRYLSFQVASDLIREAS